MILNPAISLKYICCISAVVCIIAAALHLEASAKSEVSVSPSCGPKSGFGLSVNASGLVPNGIITWNLLDSEGIIPITGYFHTDGSGNVNDTITIDDVKKGNYKIYFGYDENIDGELDSEIDHADIDVPCQN